MLERCVRGRTADVTENRLRRGVYLPAFGPFGDPNAVVDLAVRAEAAGWDGVFLWDHVVSDAPPIADSWTTLAAIALATQRIVLGPTVTPLPRRRPWVVARQASTVSRLSGGRLVLGVGLGSDESGDFSRFGEQTDQAARAAMLDEGLGILRAIWSGEPIEHTGADYEVHLEAAEPEPHPIPVWIASSTRHPGVLRRAADYDGIFPISDHTLAPEELANIVAGLRGAGLQPNHRYDVVVSGNASPAWERPNPDGVDLTALAEAGATWWMESLIHFDPLELSLEVVDAGPP
jgi:alkanesulfonate monooxygenase SsuD/methylene tetrahydromethanopterin reductase-like flavin-dependent oxidoreductase (luciferase family)